MAKKKGVVRSFFGSVFNIKKGTSIQQIVTYGKTIKDTLSDFFKQSRPQTKPETFAEATKRLNLDEPTLRKRTKTFLYTTILYSVFGLILLFYFFYLVFTASSLLALLMCLILILVMFSYAFRESFWYMQMKKRKIGCSFKEWAAFFFTGGKQ